MRIFAASIILTVLTSGAEASSIVTLPAMSDNAGPSVVVFGAPTVAASVVAPSSSGYTVASPSIVAFGAPPSNVDESEVAAIPVKEAKPNRTAPLPTVIRGGIAGEAFARPAPAAPPVEPEAAPESAAATPPAPEQASESAAPEPADEQVQDGPVLR